MASISNLKSHRQMHAGAGAASAIAVATGQVGWSPKRGLGGALGIVPALMARIRAEEGVLRRDLPGYAAYTERVRH